MKVIDLRSDTVTWPTEEMRRAMYEAEVGDDASREDPTANRLQEIAAEIMGKEAALLTASGIMSNLVSVLTHTRPGDEIIMGSDCHIFWFEGGGASALGGVVMRTVPNDENGYIEPAIVKASVRQSPPSTLLCLENTHNRCGGTIITPEATATLAGLAHENGLNVHLDGARIFNAAVALGVPARRLAEPADSVCFCLSKGLSAPVGSLICGTSEFIERARRFRRLVGGSMRQVGVFAAAGIVALETMVERLAEDHATARQLAEGLANIPGIIVNPERVQTNIVMFESPPGMPASELARQMAAQGIRVGASGGQRIRAVTHRMVSADDIDQALLRTRSLLK